MLSLQLFRQDKELILAGLKKKNFKETEIVDAIIELDEKRRKIQVENDHIAASINSASKAIGQLMGQGKKEEAEAAKAEVAGKKEEARKIAETLAALEKEQNDLLIRLPNLPHHSVPAGKTPEENEVVRTGGARPALPGEKLAHWDITSGYKLIDFELGNKITGSGFPVYTGQGARLQRALIAYFLDYNTAAGYHEVYPPFMVNEASAYGTGQLPDKEGQMYHVTADNFYLIPTAEVPVTNILRDTITPESELPIRMTAYTPCFRREAGSYGKDVRGLNRLHQFDKVEIVQFTHPDKSYETLEEMVLHVEKLLQNLGLEYRILRLCGGDMSFTSALTYDFEVYSAAQERWLEVSSVSNFENFQTNRCKARFKNAEGKTQLLHSLNGSSLALPRIMACLLENFQTSDGVNIPEVLVPYFGKNVIN
ncbi:serine--tRNA ligase [Rurimicrobium arvi]|uniref:Serine--tRNA ligase n=1 Tax=Rurimicrobium arvi TaxID=2049916 RepID=A0ABP8MIG3_9BACT